MVLEDKIDKILSEKGVSLLELGVNNWALTKDDVLNVLKEFKNINVPILGGDVWIERDKVMEHTYDSWYCERLENESDSSYVSRSIDKAITYVNQYLIKDNIYFELIPFRGSV